MINHLVNYALEKIWCNPHLDYHTILQPKRITPFNGTRMKVRVLWHEIKLPDPTRFYHVYQVGALPPSKIGISKLTRDSWVRISDIMHDNTMMVDLYNIKGVQFPRFDSYIRLMLDGNFIVAVPRGYAGIELNKEALYLRFYRNAYLNSELSLSKEGIATAGRRINNSADIASVQIEISNKAELMGHTSRFINGVFTTQINQNTVKVGDWVEWVHDKSIKYIVTIPYQQLKEFSSRLDNKRKFLIHYPNRDVDTIDYLDDIDFYLVEKQGPVFKGVYYHQNTLDAVRMVTHRDYSIPSSNLAKFVNDNRNVFGTHEVSVRLHVRHSGHTRGLVFEHNRIHELYKLPDNLVIDAMIGRDSLVSAWRAENLESSSYVKIMSHLGFSLPPQLVQEALGYDAIVKIMADTPLVLEEDNSDIVTLPPALNDTGMIFEYGSDRLLKGMYYKNYEGSEYVVKGEDIKLLEIIPGNFENMVNDEEGAGEITHSDQNVNIWLNVVEGNLPPGNYSFYKVPKQLGSDDPVEDAKFEDVTDDEALVVSRENFITKDTFKAVLEGISAEILTYVGFFSDPDIEDASLIALPEPNPFAEYTEFVTREEAKNMVDLLREDINSSLVAMGEENHLLDIDLIMNDIMPLAFGFDLLRDDGRSWLLKDTMEKANGLLTVLELKRFLFDIERFLGKERQWDNDNIAGLTYQQMPGEVINTGFTFDGSSFVWEENPDEWVLMVRRNDSGVTGGGSVNAANGYIDVTITEKAMTPNGVVEIPSPVEGGKVLLWLNGHPLIRDVDYIVKWPRIIVWNKMYLNDDPNSEQDLRVFMFGNASDAAHSEEFLDVGFVKHGSLSDNDRFDLRDDKVSRVVVGGKLYHQKELGYYEDRVSNLNVGISNGEPYSVDRLPVHLDGFVEGTRVSQFKRASVELDREVSAYLSTRVKKPVITDPNGFPDWYAISSPFFGRVMRALEVGEIIVDPSDRVTDAYLESKVRDYLWLLEFDPLKVGYNKDFVFVHPHNKRHSVTVSLHHSYFLTRVNERYLNNELKLHQFLKVGDGT